MSADADPTPDPATEPLQVLIPADALQARIVELAGELSDAYPEGMVLVSVLKGSIIFVSDVIRRISVPVQIDFLAISAFAPDSGRVRIVKDLETDISGRDVVLVEDIVDTGLSITFLAGELERRRPRSLAICTLLDKTARRILPVDVRFRGFEVPDRFILGYGLDYSGRYRNLDHLLTGDLEALRGDPDCYVPELYPDPAR